MSVAGGGSPPPSGGGILFFYFLQHYKNAAVLSVINNNQGALSYWRPPKAALAHGGLRERVRVVNLRLLVV